MNYNLFTDRVRLTKLFFAMRHRGDVIDPGEQQTIVLNKMIPIYKRCEKYKKSFEDLSTEKLPLGRTLLKKFKVTDDMVHTIIRGKSKEESMDIFNMMILFGMIKQYDIYGQTYYKVTTEDEQYNTDVSPLILHY